jgi:hypothetical protein
MFPPSFSIFEVDEDSGSGFRRSSNFALRSVSRKAKLNTGLPRKDRLVLHGNGRNLDLRSTD